METQSTVEAKTFQPTPEEQKKIDFIVEKLNEVAHDHDHKVIKKDIAFLKRENELCATNHFMTQLVLSGLIVYAFKKLAGWIKENDHDLALIKAALYKKGIKL